MASPLIPGLVPQRNISSNLNLNSNQSNSRNTSPSHPRNVHTKAKAASKSPPSEAATTEAYLSWASAAGIDFPKITQAVFPGGVRGARALDPIAPDERFVTVPRAAALVVEPKGRCPCPDFVTADFWKQAPWFVKMAVLLLRESARGRESPVWGYVLQLPDSIDAPVQWTPAEVEELQYKPLQEAVQRQRALWEQQYELFAAAAAAAAAGADGRSSSSSSSASSGASRGGSDVPSWERFVWACENVRSRAFSGPYAGAPLGERLRLGGAVAAAGLAYVAWAHVPLEQALNGAIAAAVFNLLYDIILSSRLKWYALCPVVDSMNHSSKVDSTIEFEYFKDTFVVSTDTAYARGDQVFISYGPQPNEALMQFYAFFEPGSRHDTYVVPTNFGEAVRLAVTANGSLTPDSLKKARDAAGAAAGGVADQAAFRASVLGALEAELAGKPTTLAEDERLLETAHLLTPRKKAAVEFRAEKKRLLQRGIAKAKKKVEQA